MNLQFRRPDGSYVAEINGLPYHVVEGDIHWQSVLDATAEHGEPPLEPVPEPEPVTVDSFRRAIQAHIDATAQARGYDSGVTCASYVGSTIPAWAAEAAAFVAWRDAVWAYAHGELAKVEIGERVQPAVPEIMRELPSTDWPA